MVHFLSVHPLSIPKWCAGGSWSTLGPCKRCIYHLLFGWVSLVKPEEKGLNMMYVEDNFHSMISTGSLYFA